MLTVGDSVEGWSPSSQSVQFLGPQQRRWNITLWNEELAEKIARNIINVALSAENKKHNKDSVNFEHVSHLALVFLLFTLNI